MRVQETTEYSYDAVGVEEEMDMGIPDEMIGQAIQMAIKYSDPEGSFVRELTTNAFDSHLEAQSIPELSDRELINRCYLEDFTVADFDADKPYDKERLQYFRNKFSQWTNQPIKISIDVHGNTIKPNVPLVTGITLKENTDDDTKYIFSVEDFGVGMSIERIRRIYRKFFASTRRDSDNEHGGWGLGGKSPLGYTDQFFITTRFEGVERYISITMGKIKPMVNVLYTIETDEPNGTKVEVPLKYIHHREKIIRAIGTQLHYFDNIEYNNCAELDERSYRDKIFFGEHFAYRANGNIGNLHVCLGKVYYPINLDILRNATITSDDDNIFGENYWGEYYHDIYVPIGLRFEIGELDVGRLRESLEYSEKTIKALNNKLPLVKAELQAIVDDYNANIQSVEEYIGRCYKDDNQKSKATIIPLGQTEYVDDNDSIQQLSVDIVDEESALVKSELVFPKYQSGDINISLPKAIHIFNFWNIRTINGTTGTVSSDSSPSFAKFINAIKSNRVFILDEPLNSRKNKYIYERVVGNIDFNLSYYNTPDREGFYVISDKRPNISRDVLNNTSIYYRYYDLFGKEAFTYETHEVDTQIVDGYDSDNNPIFKTELREREFINAKSDEYLALMDEFCDEVDSFIRKYIPNYSEYSIDSQWEAAYKAALQEDRELARRAKEEAIPIKYWLLENQDYYHGDWRFHWKGKAHMKFEEWPSNSFILCDISDNEDYLHEIGWILAHMPDFIGNNAHNNYVQLDSLRYRCVIKVAKNNLKLVQKHFPGKVYTVKEFMEDPKTQKYIRRYVTASQINKHLPDNYATILLNPLMARIYPTAHKAAKKIKKYLINNYSGIRAANLRGQERLWNTEGQCLLLDHMEPSLHDLFVQHQLYDDEALSWFDTLKYFFDTYPLLKDVSLSEDNISEVVKYIRMVHNSRASGYINPNLLKLKGSQRHKDLIKKWRSINQELREKYSLNQG